ncbi:hypothetical protein ES708_26936 [subsurface metagenome]
MTKSLLPFTFNLPGGEIVKLSLILWKVFFPINIFPGIEFACRREAKFTVSPITVNSFLEAEPISPDMHNPVLIPILAFKLFTLLPIFIFPFSSMYFIISKLALAALSGSSSWLKGVPNIAINPSPKNLLILPPYLSIKPTIGSNILFIISVAFSGSS